MHIYTSVSYLNVPVWAMVFPKKYYFFFPFYRNTVHFELWQIFLKEKATFEL